jgi:hypothetical protein
VLRRCITCLFGLVAAAAAASCSDATYSGRHLATVVLQPQFSPHDAAIYSALRTFNLGVTSLRIVLTRPNTEETLADTTVAVGENQDSIAVVIQVAISGSQERLLASMEMSSGSVIVFQGSVEVMASLGVNPAAAVPVLVPAWVGPGKEATRVVISPRDRILGATNGHITFTATAFDANNTPITDPIYVSSFRWKVNDPTLGTIPLNGGDFVTLGKTGTAIISVFTPNLLADTVRITLAATGPMAKVKFAKGLAQVVVGASTTVAATASDGNGTAIPSATFTYTSRNTNIATVNAAGAITGVAPGQCVIVARSSDEGSSTFFEDSLLAVVGDPTGPVLLSSIDQFEYPTNTTITVSIFADMRSTSTKLGSTTIDLDWNPAQLIFQSTANGSSGAVPTVNTSGAANGHIRLALADATGFAGNVELLRITFKTGSAAATGTFALTAPEMTAANAAYTDLLPKLVQVTHSLSVH